MRIRRFNENTTTSPEAIEDMKSGLNELSENSEASKNKINEMMEISKITIDEKSNELSAMENTHLKLQEALKKLDELTTIYKEINDNLKSGEEEQFII
jgi:hypothetical protein